MYESISWQNENNKELCCYLIKHFSRLGFAACLCHIVE